MGGLILSQVFTLYTTPVIYLYLDRLRVRLRRWSSHAAVESTEWARAHDELCSAERGCFSIALLLGGCMVGPDYHRPPVPTPSAVQGAGRLDRRRARGRCTQGRLVDRLHDPLLDQLEPMVSVSNQTVVRTTPTTRRPWPKCRWRAAPCCRPSGSAPGNQTIMRRRELGAGGTNRPAPAGGGCRIARRQCQWARISGGGTPHDRGTKRPPRRRGDPGQRHLVGVDRARDRRHRAAGDGRQHRPVADRRLRTSRNRCACDQSGYRGYHAAVQR